MFDERLAPIERDRLERTVLHKAFLRHDFRATPPRILNTSVMSVVNFNFFSSKYRKR